MKKEWVVYCKPPVQGTDAVLHYLGRYVPRIAITNSRILSVQEGKVSFRYRKKLGKKNRPASGWAVMTLPVMEFMRRYLHSTCCPGGSARSGITACLAAPIARSCK